MDWKSEWWRMDGVDVRSIKRWGKSRDGAINKNNQAGKGRLKNNTYQGLLVSQSLPLRCICSHWRAVTNPKITSLDTPAFPVALATPYTLICIHALRQVKDIWKKCLFLWSPVGLVSNTPVGKSGSLKHRWDPFLNQMIQRLRVVQLHCRTDRNQTDKAEQSDLMRQRTQLFPLLELQTPNNMDTHTHT